MLATYHVFFISSPLCRSGIVTNCTVDDVAIKVLTAPAVVLRARVMQALDRAYVIWILEIRIKGLLIVHCRHWLITDLPELGITAPF